MTESESLFAVSRSLRDRPNSRQSLGIYPYTSVTAADLISQAERYVASEISEFSFARVIMAHKSQEHSDVAAGRISTVGGSIPGVDVLYEMDAILASHAGLTTIPVEKRQYFDREAHKGGRQYSKSTSLTYSVVDDDDNSSVFDRFLIGRKVVHPDSMQAVLGDISAVKIDQLIFLSPDQFEDAINCGYADVEGTSAPLIGSSTLETGIDNRFRLYEGRKPQKVILSEIVGEVKDFDREVRALFEKALPQELRYLHSKLISSSRHTEYHGELQKLIAETEGSPVEEVVCAILEFTRDSTVVDGERLIGAAYTSVLAALTTSVFAQNEDRWIDEMGEGKEALINHEAPQIGLIAQALTAIGRETRANGKTLETDFRRIDYLLSGGNMGQDMLYLLPIIATHPDLVHTSPTHSLFYVNRFLSNLLTFALKDVNASLGTPVEEDISLSRLLRQTANTMSRAPGYQLDAFLDSLDDVIESYLSTATGLGVHELRDLWKQLSNVYSDTVSEVKQANSDLVELYQSLNPRNETRTGYARNLLLMFGTDIKPNHEDESILRFESMRLYVDFLKIASTYRDWKTASEEKNHPIQNEIDRFFGSPVAREEFETITTDSGNTFELGKTIREGRAGHVRVDFREVKTFLSFLRKKYQTKDVKDFFAGNVCIMPQQDEDHTMETRIERTRQTEDDFFTHLRSNFPRTDGWNVTRVSTKDNLSAWDRYYENDDAAEHSNVDTVLSGRPGSVSDRICRLKVVYEMRKGGKSYQYEMSYYPGDDSQNVTFRDRSGKVRNAEPKKIMFLKQKRQDDADYVIRRSFAPMRLSMIDDGSYTMDELREIVGLVSWMRSRFPGPHYPSQSKKTKKYATV